MSNIEADSSLPTGVNFAERLEYLDTLPCRGDFDFRERECLIVAIAATGLPLSSLHGFELREEIPSSRVPEAKGLANISRMNGVLGIIPEATTTVWNFTGKSVTKMVAAHELAHLCWSAYEDECNIADQHEARQMHSDIHEWLAEVMYQAQMAKLPASYYHERLLEQYEADAPGSYDRTFDELWAILCQYGLGARNYLEQIQERQWKAVAE